MHKIAAVVFTLFVLASTGVAQLPTSGNVFFGYSYTNVYLTPGTRTNLNGWNGSVEGKILPFVGVVADFSGHYGSQNPSSGLCTPSGGLPGGCISTTNDGVSEYAFLFGLRGSVSVKKVRPFAEVLFGATHLNFNQNGAATATSTTSFAEALGAGIDYHLFPLVSLRLQADDLHTGSPVISHNNLRLSTGVVIRF